MSIRTRSRYKGFLLTGVAILAAAAIFVLVVSLRSSPPKPVMVLLDRNGTARLGGLLPLPGTNVRDAAFSGMAALGLKAQLSLPNGLTNLTDVIATFESMRRAGLFVTNTVPNPYE